MIDQKLLEFSMNWIAGSAAKRLSKLHKKKMAVFLCAAPIDEHNAKSDFCTNADRETTIKWLKATIKMLEDGRVLEDDSKTPEKH